MKLQKLKTPGLAHAINLVERDVARVLDWDAVGALAAARGRRFS